MARRRYATSNGLTLTSPTLRSDQIVSRFLEQAGRHCVVALALLALSGCGAGSANPGVDADASESGPALTAVTLQLNWFPEVEHGGFYAALVHGDYRAAGLDVKILPGGPETPVVQQVARRAATFGVVNADNVLFGRRSRRRSWP